MDLWEAVTSLVRRDAKLAVDKTGASADLELQAATAIILLEAAHGDEVYAWSEHRAITRGLERAFGIGREEVVELLGRAEEIRPPVVTLADVTALIAERFTKAQRFEIVRLVWKVIEADHVVDDWETVLADHVARAVGLTAEEARRAREG